MSIISTLLDNYFQIMKSINVRRVSITIIVLIILIELIELFIKPEDVEPNRRSFKNKEEKSSLLRRIVKLVDKERKPEEGEPANVYKKDEFNNYYVKETNKVHLDKIDVNEEVEILGSRTVEINTVIDENRLYMERIEK